MYFFYSVTDLGCTSEYISFNNKIPDIPKNKSLKEIFKNLDDLVGLDDVKKSLKELAALIKLKNYKYLNLDDINLNMVFLGNPGIGKTTVARMVSGILYNLNLIKEDKLIEVSAKDLIGEYLGQTAPKTHNIIESALGGVLFIDEAYILGENNSYNSEAITELLLAMENNLDNLVIIYARYNKEMQSFMNSNSGLMSRVGYILNFKDYTVDELILIFKKFLKNSGFNINIEGINKLREIINKHMNDNNFGNARFVRNIYEKSLVRHANRVKNIKNKKDIILFTSDDINDDNL